MSVTNVRACSNLRGLAIYLTTGRGEMRKRHLQQGSHRAAAIHCDAGSVADFVQLGEQIATLTSRQVQARSYIQSFSLEALDPSNPSHIRKANRVGAELARAMAENSPALVVTHVDGQGHDGCGGKLHNHIVVLNHDLETGLANTSHRMHWQVAKTNDALMKKEGLPVVERGKTVEGERSLTRADHWAKVHENFMQNGQTFDAELWDRITQALGGDAVKTWSDFVHACGVAGVQVEVKSREVKRSGEVTTVEGVTYRMEDETGPKRRMRRRKASSLSEELTKPKVEQYLQEKQREREAQRQAELEALRRHEAAQRQRQTTAAERHLAPYRSRNGQPTAAERHLGPYRRPDGQPSAAERWGLLDDEVTQQSDDWQFGG